MLKKLLNQNLIRFATVGGIGTIIKFGILILLVEIFHFDKNLSYIIAGISAILNNYYWNTIWTFSHKLNLLSLLKYFMVGAISFGIFWFLDNGIFYIYRAIVAVLAIFLINYIISRRFIWKKQFDNQKKPKVTY